MEKTLFQKKIQYLFKNLDSGYQKREAAFVALLSKTEHNYSARKKVVIHNWLHGEMKSNPHWKQFKDYQIFTWKYANEQPVFPQDCFLDTTSVQTFMTYVDAYNRNKSYPAPSKHQFDYQYLYYFNLELKQILFLKLQIISKNSEENYTISLTPSAYYTNKGISDYRGTLTKTETHYHLSVKNNFETVTFYFLLNQGFQNHQNIYGLSLELCYANLLPISKASLLTKHLLSPKEEKELYLSLNETEYLRTHAHSEAFLTKFQTKLSNLNDFMQHFTEESKENAYHTILYKSFASLSEILKHLNANKNYWVSNKRRAYKTFLESIQDKKETSCYVVTPIENSYLELFEQNTNKLIASTIESVKQGLTIEQIFVVPKVYKITESIQKTVQKLESHGILVKFFLLNSQEETSIESYDFLCTYPIDVALYRNVHDHKYRYYVSTSKEKLKKLWANFYEIKKKSYPLNEFLLEQERKDDDVLNALVGRWYHYYYGSRKYKNRYKIWKSELIIEKNAHVSYIDKGILTLEGEINTSFNPEHPFLYTTALESGSLTLTQLDRTDIYRGIFKAPILDKKLSTTLNMASIGFISKEKLEENEIRHILGNEKEGIVLEDAKMQERIIDYYNEVSGF